MLLSSAMFLLIFCLLDLSIWKRGVKVSNHISVFPFAVLSVLPQVFWHSAVRCIHFKDCYIVLEYWPLYHYVKLLFIPDNLLALKSVLSEINMPTLLLLLLLLFFWLVLAWYIFLHHFTFNLYVSLYLKWISCRQCIVGSCFLVHSDNLCPLIGLFRSLEFKVIIDTAGLIYTIFVTVFF